MSLFHPHMFRRRDFFVLLFFLAALVPTKSFCQSTIVYDNLETTPAASYSTANTNNPIFGDALNLTEGGRLTTFGCSLFNPPSIINPGVISNGTMVVNFYDNTIAYSGGPISGSLLGTATLTWDFTGSGGLPPGYYATNTFDLSSLNINLTRNILVTQQFTEIAGTSTHSGVILMSDPIVGSSPTNFYIKADFLAEGLYTSGSGQIAYQIAVNPSPAAAIVALTVIGGGLQLSVTNQPGIVWSVQCTTNLLASWSDVPVNWTTNGPLVVTALTNSAAIAYYRLKFP